MKKAVFILTVLILTFSFAGTALAAQTAADATELYNHWEANGYPDDVGGVYYDDATGNLVITLVNGDESRRREILSMVEDPAGLSFGESRYSHNEMLAVQQEIAAEMTGGGKIYSAGIGWAVVDGEVTGFGESGKESRVVVTVDQSVFAEYARTYKDRYGDMVYVESGDAVVPLDDASKTPGSIWLFPSAVVLFSLIAFAALFVNQRRLVPVMRTSSGATVTATRRLNRQEVIQAVRESAVSPSEAVHGKLMEQIERGNMEKPQ